MKCSEKIENLFKLWVKKGKNSYECSIFCDCNECGRREITGGVKAEIWVQIKRVEYDGEDLAG